MYRHPESEHWQEDDEEAYKAACLLVKLREEAARRVPEWTPEMRAELKRVYRRTGSFCIY